jgi:hypothetical protein
MAGPWPIGTAPEADGRCDPPVIDCRYAVPITSGPNNRRARILCAKASADGSGAMRFRLLPYVTVEVDDRVRLRARRAGERLRINLRAYLRSAADEVETASGRVRDLCDTAVNRVDLAVANVNDKIAPAPPTDPTGSSDDPPKRHLQVV